jgi:hypothetical protein
LFDSLMSKNLYSINPMDSFAQSEGLEPRVIDVRAKG